MASGKGISAAVRDTVREWVTDDLVNLLWNELHDQGRMSKAGFGSRLRAESDWVRRKRVRFGTGWQRTYICKQFPAGNVGLRVNTNSLDTHIEYVTFSIDQRLIGGGRVLVPSVNIGESSSFRDRQIKRTGETATFRPFTEDELAQLENNMRFGTGSIDAMFEERY